MRKTKISNAEAYILENDQISCTCLPEFGGKIISIKDKNKDFELLFQNPRDKFTKASLDANFEEYEACGFDDAFPSIDREVITYNNRQINYADHGEIWSSSCSTEIDNEKLILNCKGQNLPYSFSKTIELSERGVLLAYKIENIGDFAFPCFYAFHCLVNLEADMKFIFPKHNGKILNVFSNCILEEKNVLYSYPLTKIKDKTFDFTKLNNNVDPIMYKYYLENAVDEGECGYEYSSHGIRAIIKYSAEKLPYLGLWITDRGFRGDCNCALEPCNGFYDSIGCALENNKCPILSPKEKMEFQIEIKFTDC